MAKPVLWVRVVLRVGVVNVFCNRGLGGPFIIWISSFIFLNHLSEQSIQSLGSLWIASKGESFFLDLTGGLTFLVDEEASASATAFCTAVVIFNGEAFGERKSLATLLIMELVWENLSHHLTYQQRVRTSSSLAYCHFRIHGTLYFLIKWSRGVNLAPWVLVLNLIEKFWKQSFNGAGNILTAEPNWVHQRMN